MDERSDRDPGGLSDGDRAPGVSRVEPTSTAVKICGLTRREDVLLSVEAGADYLGVVLVPGTPRAVGVSEGREILRDVPSRKVAVLADPSLEEAVVCAEGVEADVLQLHGRETPEFLRALRSRGRWQLWKAIRVRGMADVRSGLETFGSEADGLLLDGWHPTLMGGSGTSFSWGDVAEIRGAFPEGLAFLAAGGLGPENVEEAIRRLRPQVVDVSSGVESRPREKDPDRLRSFIRNAKRAAREKES